MTSPTEQNRLIFKIALEEYIRELRIIGRIK
jgi:hypothetical protein